MSTSRGDDYWHLKERYWRALGQFVDEFAEIEKLVYIVLMLETQIDHTTAASEYGKRGVGQLLKVICKARADHDRGENELLSRGLKGLQAIKNRRDAILHRGSVAISDSSFSVSDALWSTDPTLFKISPEDLEDMTKDLPTIKACLMFYVFTDIVNRPGNTEAKALRVLSRNRIALGFAQQAIVPWHFEDLRSTEP